MRQLINGMIIRTCEHCGVRLPENSSHNRKYCSECSKIINREKTKEKEKQRQKQNRQQFCCDPNGWVVDMSNQDYCRPCIYRNDRGYNYLCNYYIITGIRRGCKAGVGCTKRKMKEDF